MDSREERCSISGKTKLTALSGAQVPCWPQILSCVCFKLREVPPVDKDADGFYPVASFPVPDAPQNLQLSLHREVEGVIMGRWAPPVHTHGLIREYIVSSSQVRAVHCG